MSREAPQEPISDLFLAATILAMLAAVLACLIAAAFNLTIGQFLVVWLVTFLFIRRM